MSSNKLNPDELCSLNTDDLDVDELERRLELADGLVGTMGDCYGYIGCGCNCQSNYCPTNSCN